VLYDAVAVCGIGEFDPQTLRVFFRLAEAIGRFLVVGLGFYYCDGKIRPVAEEIVGSLLLAADRAVAGDNDPAIGESSLLVNVVVGPARSIQLREDVFSTSVCFRIECHESLIRWASIREGWMRRQKDNKFSCRMYLKTWVSFRKLKTVNEGERGDQPVWKSEMDVL